MAKYNYVDPTTGQPAGTQGTYHGAPLPGIGVENEARHAYQQAVAALDRQKASTLSFYGFNQKGKVNPNNPYGAYQIQQKTQGAELDQLYGQQAERGLSAGPGGVPAHGLALGQRNTALFAQGFEQQRLLKEFRDKMDAIRLGYREASWAKKHKKTSGTLQSIVGAISAGQFTPAAPQGY